jgi:hypothetical protein
MTEFPGSPRLQKGAIVGYDANNPVASVIIFQYNPQKLTRSLTAKTTGTEDSKTEVTRLTGAPDETIDLDIEIDATDQLEKAEPTAVSMGVYPQLSALEMLLYPKSTTMIKNTALMLSGTMEIISPEAPFVLFIWGVKRVLPVHLTKFTITEEAFDTMLNPTVAKVSLTLQVLNYNYFSVTHPGYYAFLAHQVIKETMAVLGSVNNISAAGGNINLP